MPVCLIPLWYVGRPLLDGLWCQQGRPSTVANQSDACCAVLPACLPACLRLGGCRDLANNNVQEVEADAFKNQWGSKHGGANKILSFDKLYVVH